MSDWMAWRTVGFTKQWKDIGTFWSLNHDWMVWRTVGFTKQWKDNGTFWSLDPDWMTWRTVGFSKQWKDNGTFWSLDPDWMVLPYKAHIQRYSSLRTNWGWHGLIFVIVLGMLRAFQWQRLLCPRLQGNQRRDSSDRWRHRDPCVVLDTNLVTKTSLEEMYGIWENWRRRENCQMACRWIYQSSSTGTYLVSLEAAVCGTYIAAGYGCKQRNQLIGWAYIHEHINFEPVFSYL
jgi:hypothetical protein